jgi:hypothetical protein
MRKFIFVALPVVALLQTIPAFADSGHSRSVIAEAIRFEEVCAQKLYEISKNDVNQARVIENAANYYEELGKRMVDKANEMRQEELIADPEYRRMLEKNSQDMELLSKHNFESNAERRQAANMLYNISKHDEEAAREHADHAARMRAHLERMR